MDKFMATVERSRRTSKVKDVLHASLVLRADADKEWWECTIMKQGQHCVGIGDTPGAATDEAVSLLQERL